MYAKLYYYYYPIKIDFVVEKNIVNFSHRGNFKDQVPHLYHLRIYIVNHSNTCSVSCITVSRELGIPMDAVVAPDTVLSSCWPGHCSGVRRSSSESLNSSRPETEVAPVSSQSRREYPNSASLSTVLPPQREL